MQFNFNLNNLEGKNIFERPLNKYYLANALD